MVRDPAIPALLSVTGAAELLGFARSHVNSLVHEGKLPAAWAGSTLVLAKATVEAYKRGEQFSYPHSLDIYRFDTGSDQWAFVTRRVVPPDFELPESMTPAEVGGDPAESYRVEVLDSAGRTVGLVPVQGEQ